MVLIAIILMPSHNEGWFRVSPYSTDILNKAVVNKEVNVQPEDNVHIIHTYNQYIGEKFVSVTGENCFSHHFYIHCVYKLIYTVLVNIVYTVNIDKNCRCIILM